VDDAKIGYRAAIDELDEILASIESTDVDIDELSAKVQRAQQLIELCASRIAKAQDDVARVIDRLEEGDG
jgi:exodeoxyribonuclease VII small subunit